MSEPVSMQVQASLLELALPLREQLAQIATRTAELQRELRDLREATQQISKVLRGLEGTKAPAKGAGSGGETRRARKREAVQAFVEGNRYAYQDGFTNQQLLADLNRNGERHSKDAVRLATKDMHERGLLRVDRKARGGGSVYKLVGNA